MTEQKEPKALEAYVLEISTHEVRHHGAKWTYFRATVKFLLSARIVDFNLTKEQFDVLREALEENTHVVLPDGQMDGVYIERESA